MLQQFFQDDGFLLDNVFSIVDQTSPLNWSQLARFARNDAIRMQRIRATRLPNANNAEERAFDIYRYALYATVARAFSNLSEFRSRYPRYQMTPRDPQDPSEPNPPYAGIIRGSYDSVLDAYENDFHAVRRELHPLQTSSLPITPEQPGTPDEFIQTRRHDRLYPDFADEPDGDEPDEPLAPPPSVMAIPSERFPAAAREDQEVQEEVVGEDVSYYCFLVHSTPDCSNASSSKCTPQKPEQGR